MKDTNYLLGLGSSAENGHLFINQAIEHIQQKCGQLCGRSDIIITDGVDCPMPLIFHNAAIALASSLPPLSLLNSLLEIEQAMGRVRTVRNGPRTIDLDILWAENIVVNTPELSIPHPRFWEREFAVVPAMQAAKHAGWAESVIPKEVGTQRISFLSGSRFSTE